MARQSVSKHLAVLEAAGLVVTVREAGRLTTSTRPRQADRRSVDHAVRPAAARSPRRSEASTGEADDSCNRRNVQPTHHVRVPTPASAPHPNGCGARSPGPRAAGAGAACARHRLEGRVNDGWRIADVTVVDAVKVVIDGNAIAGSRTRGTPAPSGRREWHRREAARCARPNAVRRSRSTSTTSAKP